MPPQESLSVYPTTVVIQRPAMTHHYQVTVHIKRPGAKPSGGRHDLIIDVDLDQFLKDFTSETESPRLLLAQNRKLIAQRIIEQLARDYLNAEKPGARLAGTAQRAEGSNGQKRATAAVLVKLLP
jgi:hypothetical protein